MKAATANAPMISIQFIIPLLLQLPNTIRLRTYSLDAQYTCKEDTRPSPIHPRYGLLYVHRCCIWYSPGHEAEHSLAILVDFVPKRNLPKVDCNVDIVRSSLFLQTIVA